MKVSKNKIAPPFQTATIDVYYAHGVDKLNELVLVAKEVGVLEGTSWLRFINPETGEVYTDADGNEIKWNGVSKVREALADDVTNNGSVLYNTLFNAVQQVIRG